MTAMNDRYDWEKLYQAAILETDDSRLKAKIECAQAAIDARLKQLSSNGNSSDDERTAIDDARIGLTVLRRERQRAS